MRLSSHSLSIRRVVKSPRDGAREVEESSLCEHTKKYVKWDDKRLLDEATLRLLLTRVYQEL